MRLLSAAFLCLIFVELFCPVFCDEPSFAAEIKDSKTFAAAVIEDENQTSENSMSAHNCEDPNHDGAVCDDECLCHSAAISSFHGINLKQNFSYKESIAFGYGEPLFNSLPPPFQPPKNS